MRNLTKELNKQTDLLYNNVIKIMLQVDKNLQETYGQTMTKKALLFLEIFLLSVKIKTFIKEKKKRKNYGVS